MSKGIERHTLVISGIGGRGVLMAGRLVADAAMAQYKYVSWFPSYASAMRGGDSECTVILSDEDIYSPVIWQPEAVIILASVQMAPWEKRSAPGTVFLVDNSVVTQKPERTDIQAICLPATWEAQQLGVPQSANLVLIGAYLKATSALSLEVVAQTIEKRFGKGKRAALVGSNIAAINRGADLWTQLSS